MPCVRRAAGPGRACRLHVVPRDRPVDRILGRSRQSGAAQVLGSGARGARFGISVYVHGSGWRRAIHAFKYRGAWRLARALGEWYGASLCGSGLYGDVDVVVPLPLHPFKRMSRGYNQAEYIAEGIAVQLGVGVDRRSVRRSRNTASQALKPRRERADNVENAFAVRHPGRLAGKHVLLVDDVMTTGSTLIACIEAVVHAVPDCRVSVAALAVSRHELGVKE